MNREQRIDDLVKKILSGEEELIYELWRELEGLCAWYCRKLLKQLPEAFKLEYGDLYNCGHIALCNALHNCALGKYRKFTTYYLCYLVGTIYQENRLSQGGHYADGRRRFDPIISGGTASLDAPTDENQESPEPLYNFLSNEQLATPFPNAADLMIEQVYQQQLHDILEELIADLTEQQQFVIRQKYYEGKDCAAIAKELRIIRSRVYALEDQGLLQLKKTGQTVRLEKFLNDEIDYYAGTGLSRFKQSGASSTERLAQRRMELEARFAKQL